MDFNEINDTKSALDRLIKTRKQEERSFVKKLLALLVIVIISYIVASMVQNNLKSYEVDKRSLMAKVYQENNITVKHYKVITY